jgi:hypothetical protein
MCNFGCFDTFYAHCFRLIVKWHLVLKQLQDGNLKIISFNFKLLEAELNPP